jgi:hypothetical protein
MQDALGPFELASTTRRQAAAATVDEVLSHANGGPEPSRRNILPRHRGSNLRGRFGERARRRVRRIGLDGSNPTTLQTFFAIA